MFMDSTIVKVHPDAAGALKKKGEQSIGRSKGGLTTKIHVLAINERRAFAVLLTGGQIHDCPNGKELLEIGGDRLIEADLAVDKAYKMGYNVITPPLSNTKEPWKFDKKSTRNVTGLRGYSAESSAVSARCSPDTTNCIPSYLGFVYFDLIMELLRFSVNTP